MTQAVAPAVPRPFIGAFESTYLPGHAVDIAELTGRLDLWRHDTDLLADAGVRRARYALRWHAIEQSPGEYDWRSSDAELAYLRERGIQPIIDFVHHTSYPEWLDDGFRDGRFGRAYLLYVTAAAERYPWISEYTLFNEPFATLFLSGHEALWPPYDSGIAGFLRLLLNVLPAVSAAEKITRRMLPSARHVWVDTCEHHSAAGAGPAAYAALANDRRHVVLDLALHHDLDPGRPFLAELLAAGGERLLDLEPLTVDVLGLDYYCHSEWWYTEARGHAPSPHPVGFAAIAEQYGDRYGLPMMLSETNIRGLPSDRASWMKHTLEQYELALGRGVRLEGYCWFPHVDSSDWDSLLARPAGRLDPVGVISLAADLSRQQTVFTEAWGSALNGMPLNELPSYRFQTPCDSQLAGLLPLMQHWNWTEPPAGNSTLRASEPQHRWEYRDRDELDIA